MPILIEQHVEELRVELQNAIDASERCQILAELNRAQAEREFILTRQRTTKDLEHAADISVGGLAWSAVL